MKKIILAAIIVLTIGMLTTTITKDNTVKTVKASKTAISIDKSILGTAD